MIRAHTTNTMINEIFAVVGAAFLGILQAGTASASFQKINPVDQLQPADFLPKPAAATPVKKKVAMTDIRFEEFDIEELSLEAMAFSAMSRSFESLDRVDFIKYVAAHKQVEKLKRKMHVVAAKTNDGVLDSYTKSIFKLALKELLREKGLTPASYKQIGSVISSSNDLSTRFKTILASNAYKAEL